MGFSIDNKLKTAQKALGSYGHTGRTLAEKMQVIFNKFALAIAPREDIDLDEFMDSYIVLPGESSSEEGKYRISRFEFLRKVAKKLSISSPCQEIGVIKGAQMGYTTLGVGWHAYIAKICPAPSMLIQPTEEGVKDWMEQKFETTIKASYKLDGLLGRNNKHNLSSTKKRKYFPGGYLATASSNSPMSVRSKSIKYLDIDEEDGCNQDVGKEGSSIYLAIRRTANFGDSKIYRNSTPLLEETSSISPFVQSGTNEHYVVPCPMCNEDLEEYGTYFEIQFENLKYVNNDPRTTQCVCPVCGSLFGEHYKPFLISNGKWIRYNPTAQKKFWDDERREEIITNLIRKGYHQVSTEDKLYLEHTSIPDDNELRCTFTNDSLLSPLGFYSWQDAVSDFITATTKKDKLLLKAFYNTVLGKTWRESTDSTVDYKNLSHKKELYSQDGSFDIPMDALVLTLGVDVQENRLEWHLIGHGYDSEEWVIDYRVAYGDTSIIGDKDFLYNNSSTCWKELYEYVQRSFTHESGKQINIRICLIDSRYRSSVVFNFCNRCKSLPIRPLRGKEGWADGYIRIKTTANRYGLYPVEAFTDQMKVDLYSKLSRDPGGPNSIHFSSTITYPSLYWKGLVIESLKKRRTGKGSEVLYWENPVGGRNEPLDTYCYARAGFYALKPDLRQIELSLVTGVDTTKHKKRLKKLSSGISV